MANTEKRCCSCCLRPRAIIIISILGITLIVLGVVLRGVIDEIFRENIDKNLVLSPQSPVYKSWHRSSIPVRSNYYFFHVINPDEVREGKQPAVEEKGPYSWSTYSEKVNITWDNENETVTYDERTWYVTDPKPSCPTCDPSKDEVTTVNIPLLVVANLLQSYPDYLHWKLAVSALLASYSEDLFVTHTVNELLWGYQDPLLVEVAKLREQLPSFLKSMIPEIQTTVLLIPNNTLQGQTTVHTGAKGIDTVQEWARWKDKDDFAIWLTKYANMFNGTDGRQFAPRTSKSDTIYFITPELCRSMYITYDHSLEFQGIHVDRFTIPRELFLNGSVNSDNAAFYPQGFLPTGILDSRACQGGQGNISAPIFLSAPHFYLGDPQLAEAIYGLKPNKEKHELMFDIEPTLGSPLRNAIRFQINAFIESVKDVIQTSGVRKVYMPVMWFEVSAILDSGTLGLFRDDIILPMNICHYVEIAMISVGSIILFVEVVILCCIAKRKKSVYSRLCCCTSLDSQALLPTE